MRTGWDGDTCMEDRMRNVRMDVETWLRENRREPPQAISAERVAHDLTVVIPTLGRPILKEALRAIAAGSAQPARLVIVHQGDDPAVRDWIDEIGEQLSIEYEPSSTRGVSAARNVGLQKVETRFVAMTDDDCVARNDWVARLAGRLRAEPDRLVTGQMDPVGDQNISITSPDFDVQDRPRLRNDILTGGNMAFAVEVCSDVGPFDEDPCLAHAEDKEYAYRALRAGYSITYDPDLVVGHVAWRDESNRGDQYDGYALSLAGFYGKYLRRGDAFMVLRIALHLARCSKRWLVGVLRRDRERAAYGRTYVRLFFPGFMRGWRAGG